MSIFVSRIAVSLCMVSVPCAAVAETFLVTGSVNLRSGPGIGYARMATVPQGSMVYVHSCVPSNSWCNVSYGNLSGWASGRYMVPVVGVAPYVGSYSGVGSQFPTHFPSTGVVVAGSVPVLHAPVQLPPAIVFNHTSTFPGRAIRYQQVITNQPVVLHSWPNSYFVGQVGSIQDVMR